MQAEFLAELSAILGYQVAAEQLLNLDQTDSVRASLSAGYHLALQQREPAFRKFFSETGVSQFFSIVDCLAKELGNEGAVLHMKKSKYCGAVSSTAETLLSHAKQLIRWDGDSLNALSTDGTQGIILDWNQDDPTEYFEIAIWGDRWSLTALFCDSNLIP
jgi:hypothetical protein